MKPTDLIVHQTLFGEWQVQQAKDFFGENPNDTRLLTFKADGQSAEDFIKFFAEVFEPRDGINIILL